MSPFFNLKSKSAFFFGLGIAAFVAIRCIWLWQPQRQVELHQVALQEAVGDRDWKALGNLIADDFKHPAGYDKAQLLKDAGQVRQQFFSLAVTSEFPELTLAPAHDSATVSARLRLEGSGTAVASYVMSEVNGSTAPFVFTWKKQSWKPWDWQLTMAEHPLIQRAPRGVW